jgi:hypothetical protein
MRRRHRVTFLDRIATIGEDHFPEVDATPAASASMPGESSSGVVPAAAAGSEGYSLASDPAFAPMSAAAHLGAGIPLMKWSR